MGDSSESVPLVTPQPASPRDPSRMERPLHGLSSLGKRLRKLISDLSRSKTAMIGVGIVLFWIFVAVAAPLISPYPPTELVGQR